MQEITDLMLSIPKLRAKPTHDLISKIYSTTSIPHTVFHYSLVKPLYSGLQMASECSWTLFD